MNRDRGAIKWTSMMLPEHVHQLKKLAENHQKKRKPSIDSQLLDEWSRLLSEAYHQEISLSITTISNGIENCFTGFIQRINQLQRTITIEDMYHSERTTLQLSDITNITVDIDTEDEY
ncbi:YolD-like family protein [Evansella sp. AB-rgal1]|uniref:YolD-like family protein n=1 Tax=Evansella sp. AB-rgal1 TaxID=3242696 RepID=UPI00359DD7A5